MSHALIKNNHSYYAKSTLTLALSCALVLSPALHAMEEEPIAIVMAPKSLQTPRGPSIVRLDFDRRNPEILRVLLTNETVLGFSVATKKYISDEPYEIPPAEVARISKNSGRLLNGQANEDGHAIDETVQVKRSFMNQGASNNLYTASITDDCNHHKQKVAAGHDCMLREHWFDNEELWPNDEHQPRRTVAIYRMKEHHNEQADQP